MKERSGLRPHARIRNGWAEVTRRRGNLGLAIALSLGLWSALPNPADAGEVAPHEVTWAHSSPAQISRFILFLSPVRGDMSSARQVEVGKPAGASSGSLQFFSAIVPLDFEEFVAIGAVDNAGVLSATSNWSAVPPSRPGQPLVVEP
jgi:hypothetical protein